MNITLSILDTVILLLFIIFVVIWAIKNSKNSTSEEYFLAGKNLTWPAIGLSLFAASISSSTLIGHTGEGFISGIAVFNYNWISVLVMVVFALFFLPFYIKSGIFTIPEFLERRFDSRSRIYFSFVTIIGNVFLDAAATLYTGALVIKLIFPDVDMIYVIVIMAVIAGSYTIIGGLSSAMKADMILAVVLIAGSIVLSFYCLHAIGGWDEFYTRFHDGLWLKLTRPMNDPTVPWLGMILGIPILGFYFWGNNQVMVQRVLSAKNIDQGRKGVLFVGFLYLFTLFIIIMPGVIARGINLFGITLPNEIISGSLLKSDFGVNTDSVYPMLIFKYLPVGLIGLILSALISALISTLSATLNSVSTLFTMDFYSKFAKNKESKHLVRVGQLTALVVLIIAVLWAPLIQRFDSLVSYYQEIASYLAPPIVATFFIGLFWKRTTATGAFTGLMSGFVMALIIMISKYVFNFNIPLHFLVLAPVLLAISSFVIILVSLITIPENEVKVAANTWSRKIWIDESKEYKGVVWYKNFRVLALILVIICFLEYLLFF